MDASTLTASVNPDLPASTRSLRWDLPRETSDRVRGDGHLIDVCIIEVIETVLKRFSKNFMGLNAIELVFKKKHKKV
jgi:hypothetical protein